MNRGRSHGPEMRHTRQKLRITYKIFVAQAHEKRSLTLRRRKPLTLVTWALEAWSGNNNKTDLQTEVMKLWTAFNWLRIGVRSNGERFSISFRLPKRDCIRREHAIF
jgi:hypothetical protein